ncbi:hypothetical protein L6172_15815 [Thalassospiraceae bacterium SW-3-3]|nr:hypothetical protein L6172_15815 [Thalassospiraceae bacterium SW-3-3]
MTTPETKQYPATNEERKKREAEALRANLARRKQQQRSRKAVEQDTDANDQGSGSDKD